MIKLKPQRLWEGNSFLGEERLKIPHTTPADADITALTSPWQVLYAARDTEERRKIHDCCRLEYLRVPIESRH